MLYELPHSPPIPYQRFILFFPPLRGDFGEKCTSPPAPLFVKERGVDKGFLWGFWGEMHLTPNPSPCEGEGGR